MFNQNNRYNYNIRKNKKMMKYRQFNMKIIKK